MGCSSSTHVANGKPNPIQTKTKQNGHTTPQKEIVKNNSELNPNDIDLGLESKAQVPNRKPDCEPDTQHNDTKNLTKMSAQVGIMGSHEIASSTISKDPNPVKDTVDREKKITRASDTNNNSGTENIIPVIEEDDFDSASAPLSRTDMLKSRHLETQDTLEFVYKNSAKIAPPAGSDPFLSVSNPNFGNSRMNHRRGSGVPPPPRALQSTDFLARRAAGADLVMAEGDEENV